VKRLLLTALAVAALAGTPTALTAQVSAADTALVLLRAAQRFEQQGDRRLAEALFALIARDYASSPAGLEAGQRLAALRGALRAGSGRVELIVWGTMYGAWLGIGVPLMLEADDPTPYGAGLLLGAPLGFLTARSYGNSTSMSVGQARAIRWGTIWGTWQGAGWREVLDIGDRTETYCAPPEYGGYCNTYRVESDVAPVTAAVLGGVAGMLASAAIARKVDIAPGTGSLVEFASLWGAGYAGGFAALLDMDGEDEALTMVLLGGNAGLLAAAAAGPKLNMSAARARLISVTGVAGLVAGLGLDLLFEVDDDKAAIAIPMATSAIGLGLGASWTSDYDSRNRDGAGAAAGALLNVRNGRVGFGVPTPLPTVLPVGYEAGRMKRELGLNVPLLKANFSTGR